ncbi:SBBP repeat-containing protein [Telmatobacter sp. DSM 110680]|uniref:SBBP repeat-containing protein n=1 Tax=Telmatobacter sp. DSM 110680 TaxID=3036704 RepID=A0AAU7DG82_9BACT
MKLSGLCLSGILVCLALCFPVASIADRAAHKTRISIPLTFEANNGQVATQYRFVSRHQGVQGLFSLSGPDFLIPSVKGGSRLIQMRFDKASETRELNGIAMLPGHANYLLGSDHTKWIRGIATYGEIKYRNLYPGIDLAFHGQDNRAQLEHDFLIAPYADPRGIAFGFGAKESVRINPAGQLLVGNGDHPITFDPPQAWQDTRSGKVPVATSFVKKGPHTVGFRVGRYDPAQPLTIDPVLQFATYLDGTTQDVITDIATDPSGNVYVTGWTSSTDFPTASAKQSQLASAPDAFVAKLDPTLHTLLFSTYLGGTNSDQGQSIAVDTSGNVAVSGISSSRDFPAAGKLSSTISTFTTTYNFLASLTADGSSLRYSGYVGSTDGAYDDYNPRQNRVVFDPNGNVYMSGTTEDPTYPYTPGAYGGLPAAYPADPTLFVLKAGKDGTILYGATIPELPQQQNLGTGHRIDLGGLAVTRMAKWSSGVQPGTSFQ